MTRSIPAPTARDSEEVDGARPTRPAVRAVVRRQEQIAAELASALPGTTISLDAINAERGLYGGEGIPLFEWAKTVDLGRQRAKAFLSRRETVIVDDTSSPRFLRDDWRELCVAADAPLALVFVDTPEEIIRRRLADNRTAGRRRDVTDQVMAVHLDTFEPPDDDEQAVHVRHHEHDLSRLISDVQHRWSAGEFYGASVSPNDGTRPPSR